MLSTPYLYKIVFVGHESLISFVNVWPNKGNYKPDEPKNHRKERNEGKEARAREKKTSNSL